MGNTIKTSIAPWLAVNDGLKAVSFYVSAFGAAETYRMEDPGGGLVVRFSVEGAEFWISAEPNDKQTPANSGDGLIRMILTVADPEAIFAQALKAGAAEISPVREEYGWKVGRLADPFGHHWEIGHELDV